MNYLPVVDLWDSATVRAIKSGQLKLQRGQWVKCGSEKLSRFVSCNGVTLNVAHDNETFKRRVELLR